MEEEPPELIVENERSSRKRKAGQRSMVMLSKPTFVSQGPFPVKTEWKEPDWNLQS